MLAFLPCTHSCDNVDCTGLDMLTGWRMDESLKPSSTVSLHPARVPFAAHSFTTKMYVRMTWEHLALTIDNWRALELTVVGGDAISNISSVRERRGSLAKLRKNKGIDRGECRSSRQSETHWCQHYNRTCKSHIGLFSQPQHCSSCRIDFN